MLLKLCAVAQKVFSNKTEIAIGRHTSKIIAQIVAGVSFIGFLVEKSFPCLHISMSSESLQQSMTNISARDQFPL